MLNKVMKKQKNLKQETYLDTMIKYQEKQYSPGAYLGGDIHPALQAKTKAGGYAMVAGGTFLLPIIFYHLVTHFSLEEIPIITPLLFALLLILVGIKFIRNNSNSK
jgi:hypothetical protein